MSASQAKPDEVSGEVMKSYRDRIREAQVIYGIAPSVQAIITDLLNEVASSLSRRAAEPVSEAEQVGRLIQQALDLAPKAGLFLEITVKEARANV